ncbi:gliding motility-associated C-terminal domain-containing protein [Hymenobacter sp. HSC-4F20]|uniref:T9SS type B sorting domain-containing protein n=1 Tax=Hymenobacter sp. HSC-4F20 TaxID=2864135 RepID=UPI001C7378D8|nr:gliding motility-associated C-terminal domain-containing protein [Hymenobacter sp. HSC-4F20]MBX0290445.1 gliding motility-associated C-terminal domain-containing protein [Hymenobacter sp. HSC-4F20]
MKYVTLFFRAKRLWLAVVLLMLLTGPAARATHIVGGELDLQYRSGSSYALTLTLYFDAINGSPGALDDDMRASIFEKGTNLRMQNVVLPLTSNTFVSYTNPACTSSALSTRKLIYTTTISLPAATYASTGGYYVAVERCCRNQGLSNIVNSLGAAQAFYLEFPAVVRNGQPFLDSTPRIFPALGDYACRGELFYYDFGGQDPDGDSLAYDLVTPLNGHASTGNSNPNQAAPAPYAPITWVAGLGEQNQIPGNPTLGVDARTGRLTVRPTQLGLFVFGVRCSEYRGGVKIGETRRDFQLFVLNCPRNTAPSLELQSTTGRPYRPGRDTLRLVPGADRCLQVRFTDPDANSRLTLSLRPVNFTTPVPGFTTPAAGLVRAPGAPDSLTARFCFPDCLNSNGQVYLLDVIVADDGCSLPKRDTVRVAFTATLPPNAPPLLTSTLPPPLNAQDAPPVTIRVPLGTTYLATLTGLDTDGDALALTATGQRFDLAAAGMRFTAQNGRGQASGTFQWEATCAAQALTSELLVTFRLQESAVCNTLAQTRTVRFEVVPTPDTVAFLPPNIITPNRDGRNDVFTLPDLPPDLCDGRFGGITIYSRWGQEVYHSGSRGFRWGGRGVAGTYYFLITYTDGRKYKGWLQVNP